jgi:predicted DNA-binding antitoxin AbrB/MazE fold protein
MHQVIKATYENGVLKPGQPLPLHDQQQVVLVVLPVASTSPTPRADPERVASMQLQIDAWLKIQRTDAIRQPLADKEQTTLVQETDALLAEIRLATGEVDEAQLLADIEAALAEVQALSAEEIAALDTELNAMMTE